MCVYITNISPTYMCMKQLPLNPAYYRDRPMPSGGEEAKIILSRPHRHHAKVMGSLHTKKIIEIGSTPCNLEFNLDFPV